VYSLNPTRIAAVDVVEIRALQFTTRKAEYIVGVAKEIASGKLAADQLAPLSDGEVIDRLSSLRGVGRWTAEWVLARLLGRPRVVAGDLGVRKAVGLAYLPTPDDRGLALPSEVEVRAVTAHWGPSAGVAQALMLHGLVEGMLEAR